MAVRFTLDIDYSTEDIEANGARMEARGSFQYFDRVPVGFCLTPRFFAPIFGMPYRAFFQSAEEQYHWQLQFLKYRIENIPEDMICTDTTLCVAPYFDNVKDSASFGAEVVWPENEPPCTQPTVTTVEQMDRFEIPAPDAGLWGQARDWWLQMRQFARETRLTFNKKVEGRIDVARLGVGWLSPHMIAVDLVGPDFYWWLVEYPENCHAFLAKITAGSMAAQRSFMTMDGPAARLLLRRGRQCTGHVAGHVQGVLRAVHQAVVRRVRHDRSRHAHVRAERASAPGPGRGSAGDGL